MRLIALEEHMFPADILADNGLDLGARAGRKAAELDEVGEGRLKLMDAAGIDVQVLSCLSHVVQELPPDRAVPVTRQLNDRMAAVVATRPDRFRAFAALPLTDPREAVAELRRSIDDLGFVGAMVHGQTRGTFLDEPVLRPVLREAERLRAPLYLHPAPPPPAVMEAYFHGLPPDLAGVLSTSGWGWHAEVGMHVLRMVVNGVFDECPDLQLIVGHMGEGLPFSLQRAEEMIGPVLGGRTGVRDVVLRNVHITTCGYTSVPPLLCAIGVFGADRMLFSVDHPFADSATAAEFLRTAPLGPLDRVKIAHTNAERLLGV